ncbi:MAG: hypothetical protein IPM29_30285 [Planctomycetes bacterium]|nr:hypothetical protein [Planctomycetota bacterium]
MIPGVGRTNVVILVIGVLGCTALAFAMRQAVGLRAERQPNAALIRDVTELCGQRLADRVRFQQDGRIARLELTLRPGLPNGELLRDAGNLVWRQLGAEGGLYAVHVVHRAAAGAPRTYDVPPPWRPREPMRELPDPPAAAPH